MPTGKWLLTDKIGNFRSEYEYKIDYEYGFELEFWGLWLGLQDSRDPWLYTTVNFCPRSLHPGQATSILTRQSPHPTLLDFIVVIMFGIPAYMPRLPELFVAVKTIWRQLSAFREVVMWRSIKLVKWSFCPL